MPTFAERFAADLEALNDLPSPSPVLVKLTSTLGRDDVELREIEALIVRDPVIAARVIQAANSAAFAGHGATSSIRNALLRLGIERVRRLALLVGLFNALPARGVPPAFWPHSLATAVCSEVILEHVATSPAAADPDVVFLAALLHDLGLLVLASHYPKDYEALREASASEGKPLIDVEVAVLGTDHATMGAQLAKQWLFPPSVCAAIRGHHRIGTVEPEHRWNTLVVHLAESLASEAKINGLDEGVTLVPDDPGLAELGITPEALPVLVVEAQQEAERAGNLLDAA